MAVLGVRVEIGPGGLPADRATVDGIERMRRVEQGEPVTHLSAHDLLQTYDCAHPSCLSDAVPGQRFCAEHQPARDAANGKTGWSRRRLSRDEALVIFRNALTELDRVPNRTQWGGLHRSPSLSTLDRIFGDYDGAVRACGFTPPEKGVADLTWTRAGILTAIERFRSEEGREVTQGISDRRPWFPSVNAVKRVFGSWTEALAAATVSGRGSMAAPATVEPVPPRVPDAPQPLEPPAPTGAPVLRETTLEPRPEEVLPVLVAVPPVGVLERLHLTGDFTSDAARVRNEATLLRRQAEALDVIAQGLDILAEDRPT